MKFTKLLSEQSLLLSIFCVSLATSFSPTQTKAFSNNLNPEFASVSRNERIVAFAHPQADSSSGVVIEETPSFIDTELRGAAMRLHTRSQAPKEGEAAEKPKPPEPYTPTHDDYLRFLVDSQHVYKAFEEATDSMSSLSEFRNTGLERVKPLETDIEFMVQEYGLDRPSVGEPGKNYAETIRNIAAKGEDNIPEFMCHYYNHYFAHTAGGRMIGKKMSSLLLDKKTLEFYKWEGDLNKIKATVKESIEKLAASWTKEQRQQCVDGTAAAFMGGGAINSHLSGGRSPH